MSSRGRKRKLRKDGPAYARRVAKLDWRIREAAASKGERSCPHCTRIPISLAALEQHMGAVHPKAVRERKALEKLALKR